MRDWKSNSQAERDAFLRIVDDLDTPVRRVEDTWDCVLSRFNNRAGQLFERVC